MTPQFHRTPDGGKKMATRILFFLTTVVFVTAVAVYAQQDVGLVVNLNGDWFISTRKLGYGSPLKDGEIIRARNPVTGDFIEIADLNGRIIRTFNCSRDNCKQPIEVRAAKSSIFSRVFRAAMTILYKEPKKHQVLISRGGGELRESVVKIAGEQVELSSVLADLSAGSYLLKFEAQRLGAPPISNPVRVDWNPSGLSPVTVKGLTPGLYVVRLLNNQDREPGEPGTEAWVLLAKPEKFDKAFCEFREVVDLTNQWGTSVRLTSKRQLLRATLTSLETQAR